MKRIWMIGLLMTAWCQLACAVALDVGMLTQVVGNVSITSNSGEKHAGIAFLKVAVGDKLTLGNDARIQIVYFDTSHQELWKGPGQIEIGAGDGKSPTLQAEVKKLPPLVARQLIKTPASGQLGATGMVTVRSLSSDTVESLQKQYEDYKASAAADDTTPEVFLMTGLLEMKEYEEAAKTLDGLRAKQVADPGLTAVVEHFDSLVKEGAAQQ